MTIRNKTRKSNRLSMLALAFSLSAGTVAGLVGIAALTAGPANAQSAGGNGGGGGGGNGGAGGSPMAITMGNPAINVNNGPPRRRVAAIPRLPKYCGGSADSFDTASCRYVLR